MKKLFLITLGLSLIMLTSCSLKDSDEKDVNKVYQGSPITKTTMPDSNFKQDAKPDKGEQIVVMETNMGTVKIKLFPKKTPKTVENFVGLIGKKYYDGLIFHRVIDDFMIQGGDPTGTGTGGASLWGTKFKDEFHVDLKHVYGALSMANSGPASNGSQFFIVQNKEGTAWLNNSHSVFGQVFEGMDVIEKIADVKKDANNKPLKKVIMKKVTVSTY